MLPASNTLVWYRAYIHVGEMCFIPMNVHIELASCSVVFVTMFVSSDGSTFHLFTVIELTKLMYFQYFI